MFKEMEEDFLLYFSPVEVEDIEEIRNILRKIEFLTLSGKSVYILPHQRKELLEWAELMSANQGGESPGYKDVQGKDTNFFDIVDILLEKLRDVKGKGHLFWFFHQGPNSYIIKFSDTGIDLLTVMVSAQDEPQNIAEHILHADSDESVKVHRCVWLHKLSDIQLHLGKDRNYHFSGKHGNATTDGWPGESRLWSTDDEARKQVKQALRIGSSKEAWLWDVARSKYLKFFCEGDNPQRQWHGFHIDPADRSELNKIPNEVKRYFGHR